MKVGEARIKRRKAGAKLPKFSENAAKVRARVGGEISGSKSGDDGASLESAMADVAAQNELLLLTNEELRVQAEELIASQRGAEVERRRYRDLFDLTPDAHFVTDRHGTIQEANSAAGDLLAIEPRLLRGMPLSAFVQNGGARAFYAALEALQGKTNRLDLDLTVNARGHSSSQVAFHAVRMADPSFYIWSARKLCQAAETPVVGDASRSERPIVAALNDQSLSQLSQELEHSLRSILTSTEALRHSEHDADGRASELQAIEKSAARQVEILEALFEGQLIERR